MDFYILENYLDATSKPETYKYIYRLNTNNTVTTIVSKTKYSTYIDYESDSINVYYKTVSGISFIGGYSK